MEGHEVKAIRERLGITQAELADILTKMGDPPVSVRTVESWEQERRAHPNEKNAEKLRKLEKE